MRRKLKFSAVLMLCMFALGVLSVNTVYAANTNKKTLIATIGGENFSYPYRCEFKLTKKTDLKTEIKILSLSGKGKNQKTYWGIYHTDRAKGSLFYDLNPSTLKKNKTLKSLAFLRESSGIREGDIIFQLPEGIKKMKIKITISTKDGKKSIKSFKKMNWT